MAFWKEPVLFAEQTRDWLVLKFWYLGCSAMIRFKLRCNKLIVCYQKQDYAKYCKSYLNNQNLQGMSQDSYFEIYQDIISESLKKIKKIGFKKLSIISDFINKLAGFLEKQIYGRIQPTNFLFLYMLLFGSHNPKLHTVILQSVQKLFANNFINPFENLAGSEQFMRNEYKEFILMSGEVKDFFRKNIVEIYIETILNIPSTERNQQTNITIAKNISLVFRLAQSSIPGKMIPAITDFLVDSILSNKNEDYDKIFKSIFLEIIRHAIQSLRQAHDRKLLIEDDIKNKQANISIKTICQRYGNFLFDEVTARVSTQFESNNDELSFFLVPINLNAEFLPKKLEQVNENDEKNGKFGWCIICRRSANYYCKQLRVPVCSFNCKQINLKQTQEFDKLNADQMKCASIYAKHLKYFCRVFAKYLSHSDIRRRSVFSEIFIHLSSEIRKISPKTLTPDIKAGLNDIFRQCCANVISETQALTGCIISIKKMIPLKIFNAQVEILLHQISKKLTHFITAANIKEEMLKFCRDIIRSQLLFEIFMDIDCHPHRRDVIKEIVNAISTVYNGIPTPSGLSNIPTEDPNIRRFCLQILYQLEKSIRGCHRVLPVGHCEEIRKLKQEKNRVKKAINEFNNVEKPTKLIKKLIKDRFFKSQNKAQEIATFLHKFNKKLNHVNIGVLVGDYDPLAIQIRDIFISKLNFKGQLIDSALRILLKNFTIPGEAQVVQRVIDCFSKQYFNQNQGTPFRHSDSVYSFSYLLMMLQTSLHSPQVQQAERMTLPAFAKLSKGMNKIDEDMGEQFPQQFLSQVYSSVQKEQLGFHTKHKQIQMINAYQQNQIKKAQEIHNKSLDEFIHKEFKNIVPYQQYTREQPFDKFDIKLICTELFPDILIAISTKIHESEEKEEILRNIQIIEHIIKFSLQKDIEELVEFSVRILWEEMMKTNTMKKYILMEKLLIWVREYNMYLYNEWSSVIYLFSMFHRNKLIKKDNSGKNHIIVISQEKCYLYESFIQSIIAKTAKFNHRNLVNIVDALIQSSKQEILENQHPFCLEKLGEVLQHNTSRLADIVPLCWGPLKDHYIELGKHKNQKVALFGYDFLKQLVTKFLKRKDLQFFQKEYLKPFEQIFNATITLGVKEYVVGGLSYFASNYHQNINRDGWRIIFNIVGSAFEEEEDLNVKEKALTIVKKVYESKFTILEIDDSYVDFVQILSKMAREKQQVYPSSCIQAIKVVIEYFHLVHEINLEDLQAPENNKLDLIYWQTQWLPLLSTIYGICGDFRVQVQNAAIELLFQILMNYGKLFSYEFWKMVMQGILRPAFQEITYTSQSRPMQKKALEDWLRNSFALLFLNINKLIMQFLKKFKLFLPDILKIYESCILNNPSKILLQITFEALYDLVSTVGEQFEELNWFDFADFVDIIAKKSFPKEIESEQNWKHSQEFGTDHQHAYQTKCQAILLLLSTVQNLTEKYHTQLKDQLMHKICESEEGIHHLCRQFNKNISLREHLWRNGFFAEMKSLPGLVKHEHQTIKGITLIKYYLSSRSDVELDRYVKHILSIFKQYKLTLLTQASKNTLQNEQKQRMNTMLQVIILDTIMPQVKGIGFGKLIELGYRQILFEHILDICTQKTLCSKCNFCSSCEMSGERERKFTKEMKQIIKEIFEYKP